MNAMPALHHERAAALAAAREHLARAGAADLPDFPWTPGRVPHADATLIRFALWRAEQGGLDVPADLHAALQLVDSARAELDALEAGLLFLARSEGLTWPQIADHLGVRSPQAAQQRFDRTSSRAGGSAPSDDAPTSGRP
ncbi:MAG: DNA-binding protein [Austwickia sp.]|jgi:hypothetical protein|nr:MAG: DNA-binding protein [Austwickia sp.]